MGQVLRGSARTAEVVRRAIRQAPSPCGDRPHVQVHGRSAGEERQPGDGLGFLEALIAAVPYKIHTVLTDNGIRFTFPPRRADGPTARYITRMFDMRCEETASSTGSRR